MSATLDSDFENALQDALLDDVDHQLVGKQDNIVAEAISFVHGRLDSYAQRFDYRVESIKDSLVVESVERSGNRVTVRFGWTHEAMPYLEFGTSEHTIEGDPVLSFVWEQRHDPPDWVAEEFNKEGDGYRVFLPEVTVDGVRETRAVRDAMNHIRRRLQA